MGKNQESIFWDLRNWHHHRSRLKHSSCWTAKDPSWLAERFWGFSKAAWFQMSFCTWYELPILQYWSLADTNKSYFFKGTELPFRLALFWMANRLTNVIAPLMAYGILRLRGYHGLEGWRWLFLIESAFTFAIGIWSAFMMTLSPTQTKAWWRPKGWFTEREQKIMVNRILRDDPSKGDMHNRQAIT